MRNNAVSSALLIMLAASVAAGCAKSGDGGGGDAAGTSAEPAKPPEPVTLKMYQIQALWTEKDVNDLIIEPVQKKYPHITLQFEAKGDVEKALTAGEAIDLIAVWNGNMPYYKSFDIFDNITPYATKQKFDLSRFDQGALDSIKALSDKGELIGLPNMLQFNALYYNKDIFDRFGAPYPKDGMTWEDAIELAKKVTRSDGGTAYLGLDPDYLTRLLTPMSLNIVDGVTNKSSVNTEPYRKVFEIGKAIYDVPGNKPAGGIMKGSAADRFTKDRVAAMLTTVNILDRLRQTPDLNWDVAQFPSFKERPNQYGMYDLHVMTISKTSKHKEDAMRVLEVLFSDEVQLMSSKKAGKLPVMKDPKFSQAYLQDTPELQSKQIQSIFKSKPAPAPAYSMYYSKARGILVNSFVEYANGAKDVNTALRESDEAINIMIEAEQKPK
ncbi:ABC transporter substrate-binding protein [Paenibacillus sp. GYB003]|uniref:ABC transporter substrate-binding protein n=1 Tax=Paenibacillus sp. GYB003 TaxID=2994392 RepID=UPI002F96B587